MLKNELNKVEMQNYNIKINNRLYINAWRLIGYDTRNVSIQAIKNLNY